MLLLAIVAFMVLCMLSLEFIGVSLGVFLFKGGNYVVKKIKTIQIWFL